MVPDRLLPAALRPWHGAALLLLLGLWVYGPAVGFSLVTGDDWTLIAGNELVTRWAEAPLAARLFTVVFGYPIPITVASFALDWSLWGGRAAGLHLTNVLLHIGCALLLFSLLCRAVSVGAALAGALLLLLHPVQVEAAAFVTQRKDVLATLFALWALRRLIVAARGGGPAPAASVAALVLLSGLSKPSALLLGPVLCAGWLVLRGRPRARAEWALCLSLPAVAAALAALGAWVHQQNPVSLDGGAIDPGTRAALIAGAVHHYLKLLVLPLELAPRVPRPTAVEPAAALCALLVGGLLAIAAHRAKRRRWRLVLLWAIGMYLPISNVLPINRYAADSYLYLLLPAPAAALAFLMDRSRSQLSRRARWTAGLLLALWLGALGLAARAQVGVWRDDLTLRAYLYRLYPEQREAMVEYTDELARAGRRAEALGVREAFLVRALARDPGALSARHWLLRTRLERGDRAGAHAALAETPAPLRDRPAYHEAQLELAMADGDRAAARAAVQRLLALGPPPARRAQLESLAARLGP